MMQLSRAEFLNEWFDFNPGEHINIISPTGGGKTVLLGQLKERIGELHPSLRTVTLMPKLADDSTDAEIENLGYKEIQDWPPTHRFWENKPPGYVLWPEHDVNDEAANRERHTDIFRRALNSQYSDGKSLTVVDDAYIIGVLYGLNKELDRHWIAGRSNKASLVTALQKPSGTTGGAISSYAYNSPIHLFLGKDTDARNLKRFGEISASDMNPHDLEDIVRNLRIHRIDGAAVTDFLYLDRRSGRMATVGL